MPCSRGSARHRSTPARSGAGLVLFGLAAASGCRGPSVQAPPPELLADVGPAVTALPPSSLEVPIEYDLSPVLAALERAVPRTFGDIEERLPIPGNSRVHVAFEAERSPFTVTLDGQTARITSTIRYRGRGWYDPPLAPEVSASCGTGDDRDDRPRAIITMSARIDLTDDWSLRARSRLDRIGAASQSPRDQCRVTVLRIDVTERVIDAARGLIARNTRIIDEAVAGIDLRSRFEAWWDILQSPIGLTDDVWLVINPLAVRKGKAGGDGTTLRAAVGLTAAPRIVVGPRPDAVAIPLPPLDTGQVGDGLHILMEGRIDYGTAGELLTRELRGRTIERAGRTLRVRSVAVSGVGAGRLALGVDFDGSARGTVWFVGSPQYDAAAGEIVVPDLDFDVASRDLLVRGAAWIAGRGGLVEFLRDRARIPVADGVREGERLLREGLNRSLSRDVHIDGEVLAVRPLDVYASRHALIVQAHAEALGRMEIRRADGAAAAPAVR
jgi:hypothetical protein